MIQINGTLTQHFAAVLGISEESVYRLSQPEQEIYSICLTIKVYNTIY
jgi:hypothetical protein